MEESIPGAPEAGGRRGGGRRRRRGGPSGWAGRGLALLALLLAWIPWLGASLALLGLLLGRRGGRPAGLLAFALLLGLVFTAAFHLLPQGRLKGGDPRLELLEDQFQPSGNAEEIDRVP